MALSRINADSIADGTIVAAEIADGAISNTKLATGSVENYFGTQGFALGMRNRIINGDMRIDQRNAGASVSVQTDTSYTLDRWAVLAAANSKYTVQRNNGSVTPPAGFTNYFGIDVAASANVTVGATDQYLVRQGIEGFNASDLAWGTASAKTVTLSFWVRSSLTGTFGGSLNGGGGGYSYPFSYTISSANTWEYKTITIAGQTAGTWASGNTLFTWLAFDLGIGSTYSGTAGSWANTYYAGTTGATKVIQTNSATWYVTGVQLEVGSVATPFERRPFGTELFLCYRYFQKSFAYATPVGEGKSEYGNAGNTTNYATAIPYIYIKYPVQFRATPGTVTLYNPRSGGTAGQITNSSNDGSSTAAVNSAEKGFMVQSASQASNNWYIHWGANAEL